MIQDNNFAGRNDFVWFTGVIEGRDDPLKLGRLRVRIIGLHTDDTNLVPTEDLPWAQIVRPVSDTQNFSLPKDGEWVLGFFQDGHNSQIPVITGVYPGLVSETPKVDDGAVAQIAILEKELATLNSTLNLMVATGGQSPTAKRQIEQQRQKIANTQKLIDGLKENVDKKPQKGFVDRRSKREVVASPNPPAGVAIDRKGEPSLPALAREVIEKTGRDISNANREHACDFAMYVRSTMAAARIGTGKIAQEIRKAIQLVIKALAPSPGGSAIAEQIRTFAKQIKRVADMLEEINDYVTVFATYVMKIKQLIEYILGLPAKLLGMFKQCLSQAYAELAEGLRLIIADFTGATEGPEGSSEITDAVKDAFSATKDLLTEASKLYAAPAIILGAAINPTKPLTDEEAKAMISELFPDTQQHDEKTFGNGALA